MAKPKQRSGCRSDHHTFCNRRVSRVDFVHWSFDSESPRRHHYLTCSRRRLSLSRHISRATSQRLSRVPYGWREPAIIRRLAKCGLGCCDFHCIPCHLPHNPTLTHRSPLAADVRCRFNCNRRAKNRRDRGLAIDNFPITRPLEPHHLQSYVKTC